MTKHSVFISFKNTFDGKPTADAEIAEKLYTQLTQCGIETFYSNDTIKSLGASEYKQAINNALDNASVLILIGSRLDFIQEETSPWVYYEWEKFHSEYIYNRKRKIIVPYLSQAISREQTPFELRDLETFKLEKNAVDDVVEFVVNFLVSRNIIVKPAIYEKNEKSSVEQKNSFILDEVKPVQQVATNVTVYPDKTAKTLKRAKICCWVHIAMVSIYLLSIPVFFLSGMSGAAFPIMFLGFLCYPSCSLLLDYGRKLKILPKAVFASFIAVMCIPVFSVVMVILDAFGVWVLNRDESFPIVLSIVMLFIPGVGIVSSFVYSVILLRKKRSSIKG